MRFKQMSKFHFSLSAKFVTKGRIFTANCFRSCHFLFVT